MFHVRGRHVLDERIFADGLSTFGFGVPVVSQHKYVYPVESSW